MHISTSLSITVVLKVLPVDKKKQKKKYVFSIIVTLLGLKCRERELTQRWDDAGSQCEKGHFSEELSEI